MTWEYIIKEDWSKTRLGREPETLKEIVADILFGYMDGKGERKQEYVIDRALLHAIWGELQ